MGQTVLQLKQLWCGQHHVTAADVSVFKVSKEGRPYLRSFPDRLVSQAAGAHGDEPINQIEQEADRLAAALRAAHPGDLIPADALAADARDRAGQPAVLELSGAVHLHHLVQHGASGQIPEETVHVAEAVGQQSRNEPLQSQALQVRVRHVLNKGHFDGRTWTEVECLKSSAKFYKRREKSCVCGQLSETQLRLSGSTDVTC